MSFKRNGGNLYRSIVQIQDDVGEFRDVLETEFDQKTDFTRT